MLKQKFEGLKERIGTMDHIVSKTFMELVIKELCFRSLQISKTHSKDKIPSSESLYVEGDVVEGG